ncbi:hypothetical protein ElyMa_000126400 [Elysia marginata]|uniref:Uncharacterized protein n=1 Tax=Elysia marginata TaxID=1093978 RepID=A0AAV4EPE1_9GAST|nr:hypothetical protein ElyMa_000126400 [Elysia marginata]
MKPTTHNHMKPEEKALQLQKTRTSVKRKAQEITEESVGKMVYQEALKSSLITYQDVKGLKEQEKVNLKIRCVGQPSPNKRKEHREKKQKKEQLYEQYVNGEIDLTVYLRQAAKEMLPPTL